MHNFYLDNYTRKESDIVKNKNTIKNVTFVALWVLLVVVVFAFSITQQLFNSTVRNVIGKALWYFIYVVLPIITLLVPLIVRFIVNCKWKITLIYSLCIIVIYSLVAFTTSVIAYRYIQDFTEQKWADHRYERKLMLDDLNKKYTLIGMDIEDIKMLLGKPDIESENEIEYIIGVGWFDPEMMVMRFEEQRLIDIYTYTEFKSKKQELAFD